jgi:hypothetical protein
MRDSGIGRVLVASLHAAIADLMPTRLGFYESWLSPTALRTGQVGRGPLLAVCSFLRGEGARYHTVTALAARYATEWTLGGAVPAAAPGRRLVPLWWRRRRALRAAARLLRACDQRTRVSWRVRRGVATVTLRGSTFCEVREPVPDPLCHYAETVVTLLCAAHGVPEALTMTACEGMGQRTCSGTLQPLGDETSTATQDDGA